MAVYEYKATDVDAAAMAGTVVADTPRAARDNLRERGLVVTEIRPFAPSAKGRSRGSAGSKADVVSFIRELATLLRVGTPLLAALQTLSTRRARRFKAVIEDLSDKVASGVSLAEAMGGHSTYFDSLCSSIVRVGENTGHLDSALKRLAEFKDKAHRLRSRLTTALAYPAVVCVVGLVISVFLMTYVVPNLMGTLAQSGRPLPTVTRIVKGASDFLLGWWWLVLAALAVIVLALRTLLKTPWGHLAADRIVLRIPLVGELARKEITSRMAVVMAALLQSGLPFVEAVAITRGTVRNRLFQMALAKYESAVSAGSDIAAPLEASGVFSPMVVHMLAIGQQSGQLEEMLEELSSTYDQEVATATARLTALLEPALIVVIAVLVGLIAFATILPILEVSNVL